MDNFDVVLATTEDEEEALLRLSRKMDWRPELFMDPASDQYRDLKTSLGDSLNHHGAAHGEVDMSAVPAYARRALNKWTELDAALYLVASAQQQSGAEQSDAAAGAAAAAARGDGVAAAAVAGSAAGGGSDGVNLCERNTVGAVQVRIQLTA
jgi:hypothetical protein